MEESLTLPDPQRDSVLLLKKFSDRLAVPKVNLQAGFAGRHSQGAIDAYQMFVFQP